jgi:hypothetical protein
LGRTFETHPLAQEVNHVSTRKSEQDLNVAAGAGSTAHGSE